MAPEPNHSASAAEQRQHRNNESPEDHAGHNQQARRVVWQPQREDDEQRRDNDDPEPSRLRDQDDEPNPDEHQQRKRDDTLEAADLRRRWGLEPLHCSTLPERRGRDEVLTRRRVGVRRARAMCHPGFRADSIRAVAHANLGCGVPRS